MKSIIIFLLITGLSFSQTTQPAQNTVFKIYSPDGRKILAYITVKTFDTKYAYEVLYKIREAVDNFNSKKHFLEKPTTMPAPKSMKDSAEEAVKKLMAEGIIEKIDVPGTLPRLWVTPKFMFLDFKTKQVVAGVAHLYCYEGKEGILLIYENINGQKIGDFSKQNPGLRMFK